MTAGCARRPETTEDGRLKVVTTLFPYYDFVRQVAGDRVNLTLVVPAGMDSHSFEPTPADMITIQEADVLICNGGEMEHWLSQVLDSMDTSRIKIVTMMDYIDTVEEEHVEGMEEAEHGHAHGDEDDDGHGVEIEYDEHIWTSPVNAMAIVKIINSALGEALPAQAGRFDENAQAYLAELKELDGQFRQVVAQGKRHMIIVADKFPFRYFADEYGLSYRAAFSGCSSDTEPSARTIAYLIDKVEDEQIPAVYYLELSSHSTARVIGEETGAKPLLLHSCHNVTRREFDQGITYLQLMKRNVEALREGLD
ncbi:MAG: metal ABC transporter substrate-binding protein [Clostridium sp.]|nr:metal ABC transporter substrate-binding protein [Clostridium sp.]